MTREFASRKHEKLEHRKFACIMAAALNKRRALNKTTMYTQTAYATVIGDASKFCVTRF